MAFAMLLCIIFWCFCSRLSFVPLYIFCFCIRVQLNRFINWLRWMRNCFWKYTHFLLLLLLVFLSCCFSLYGVHMMLWLQPTVIIFGLIMCLIAAISLVCSICKCYLFRFSIIRFSCYTINGMLYYYMNFRSVFKVVISTPNDIAIIWWLNLCILNLFIFKCVCVCCFFLFIFVIYTY